MDPISFRRHRFPGAVIAQAARWNFRFTPGSRDVEALMHERRIEVSREAIRCWVIKFGPLIVANLSRNRSSATGRWHLDRVVAKSGGRKMHLSRTIFTDKLASCRAAMKVPGLQARHRPDRMREKVRSEDSYLMIRRRERKHSRFKSQGSAQRFLSSQGQTCNAFNLQPDLSSRAGLRALRPLADDDWVAATRARLRREGEGRSASQKT